LILAEGKMPNRNHHNLRTIQEFGQIKEILKKNANSSASLN